MKLAPQGWPNFIVGTLAWVWLWTWLQPTYGPWQTFGIIIVGAVLIGAAEGLAE